MKTHLLTYLMAGVTRSFSPKERSAQNNASGGKSPKLNFLIFLLALILLALGQKGYSQTNTWDGSSSANWNTGGNWSLNHVPLVGEDVVIPNGITTTITVNTAAVCKSFTMSAGGNNCTVSIAGGQSLSVTNAATINAPTSGGTRTISVAAGTGTFSCGSIYMTNSASDSRDAEVTLSTGTVNVTGDITMDGTTLRNAIRFTGAGTLNLGGNFLGTNGGILVPSTGTVNCNGATAQTISGLNTTSFYNLTINKTAAANTVTGTTNAFTVANDLTVTQGNLILQATNANYTVTNNVNIASNGTLTHSVDWATGKLFSIGGSFVVSGGGLFTYTVRSHVQMTSAGTENISTGTNASSAFSILTLTNGTFNANGTLRVNDNFWAMFNTAGNFHTNGQTVYANASLLCSGGTCYIDGGTLNVTGGMQVGSATAGTVSFSSGTLNADAVTLGSGAITGAFNHTGGTSNISGNLTISNTGTYTCTGSPAINISGDWINNKAAAGFVPATSTVTFNSVSAAQNINGTSVAQTFGNIVVNKSGQQLNVAGSTATLTLNGSLTITAGTFAAGTATAINIAGNWANNGTAFTAGSGTVTFNGGSAQTISGSTITTFNNITLNNSNGLTTSGVDMIVSGGAAALTFSNGKISTGSNKVTLGASATISGAGAGKYIYGNLQMGVATGSPTRVFEIGDASVYAPLSVVFNNVTVAGNVTAYTIGTEHTNILTSTIDETKSVNRYWGMSNSGMSLTNYTCTFNWVAGDVDAGATTANFIIGRRTSSWAYPTMGTRNPTNCTTTLTSFGTYACGEGGAAAPAIATQPVDQSACSGTSISYTAAVNNKPNPTAVWEISTDNGATFSTLTIASPYSVSTSTVSNVTTSTLTINPVTTGLDQYSYRAVFTNSRGTVTSFDGLLTVLAAPTANAGSALTPICGSGPSAPLGGSVGGSATGGTWSTASGGTFTPNATTLNATWTPPGGFTGTATLTLTTSGGSCGTATASKTQLVSGAAGAISITPSSASICRNAIQSLVASNTETSTFSSGTVNVAIPDLLPTGATNTMAVSGIPAGATVTGLSVTINITHTKDQDLILNLRAPNGSILNLVNTRGGSGSNFTNTVINSTSTTSITGGAPFTGTFKPDATNGVGATGQTSNVTAFSSLYSTANGNWVFSAVDGAALNSGTINSWSLAITYVDPITWSPVTYLYTNAAATTAYTAGQTYATVYTKPTVAGTYTYTATATNSAGCTTTQTVAVTAGPIVTVTPDYCYPGGYIQLSASSTPAATSWLWSTGATTSSILVNLAGNYTVTATTAGGCSASVTSPIAQELVVNGDFSSGNTGFSSTYGFVNYTSGCMYPEGIYTVGTTPNFTHSYFFGKDHTTNSGNLLIVNGSGSPVSVWQETIAVQPNTTYYFSAWAMSLNDAAPFAQLQFDINGSGIGTTAVLPAGPNSTSAPYAWVQFYGSWTSGAGVTSAVVSIKDLQTALGGNDFGLDDISFGTLTSFVSLTSATGTDNQSVCNNSPITDIIYTIGSGAGGPSVTGLPPGVSWSFTGTTLTISGTPSSTGTYSYTVTTSPCNPVTKTGVITVQDETLSLSSAAGTNAQTPCLNTAITNITYSVGGQATGATVTGLPAGVTGSYSAGVFTISGTPTVAGTTTYTVTTTGSCGTHVTLNGTMNVRRQIITRSSATGTNAQTVCVNTAITNITYSVGGTATGAGVTGLPAGVTGTYSSGVFTITGTPTAIGSFSYTITTTGTCSSVTAGGTITVNGPTVTLTSVVGTDAQSVCPGTAITDIVYNIGGTATGASISGLPAGVIGSYSLGVYTISGTPTIAGIYNYTITTSGGSCGITTEIGTITVLANNTVTLSSVAGTDVQTVCINTAMTNITYATTVATGATVTGLPTGVSGAWAANVVTISGTPTVAGTSTYTVTLTGGCAVVTTTGTITVAANNTITLSSAAGTNAQTKCINTAITNITYSTTGATGATFSGLPTGVSGGWAANVVTISGTPTVAGTSTYTVTLTGGCGSITATGTITVTANNTITLSSAAGTDAQTKCINTAITNITYSTTGATGATFSGLPTGVTGAWAANVVTISGTPTVAGTATYTVTLTGGCGSITATGTITVNANNTITLTSAAGTNAQTKCINTAITNITYSTTGATGATFSGLPTGVSGAWAANVVTISGTPTVAGTSTYTVTLTGGCSSVTATGTITVTANNTITLTSAAGTNAQTKCINTAITNITYSTTGATGATFNGLPTGVSGAWAANVVTISGTPTVAGTATYTVTLTGGCGSITATGTITVNINTVTLTSAAGTDAQTKCINTAITNITYSTTGATGATFSGLPTGVSGAWAANVVTISGTPTVAGTSTYTVTLTGGCGSVTATGTITVAANNTITLSSAAGTNAQTKCINTAITNITYSTTGATGATFSGLPTGVSGGWAANVVTISGTPTVAGTSTYTVTLTGGCGSITATGTITVTANNTITLSSAAGTDAQTKCINTAITNITYSTTGATGATFSGLPTGVTGAWAANVVTISGTPTVAGTATYTVTLTGGCGSITATGTITVNANNTITLTSAAGTNAQTKCINTAITNITYSTTGATGATFSGLPTGVSGAWAANVVTISGTPTVAGTSTYTVTLTGGCGSITATGTITVTANNTITLTSAAGTNAQTKCINTAITNITYSTTGATGATFSGLPTGVSGAWAANVVTISGTPTVAGTATYTVTLTGGCGSITATGTITVTANNTITLSSAAGTDAQTKCINTAITNITYSTTGATGATFSGLPTGVSGAWAANVVTISGTPTVAGTATYTVTLTGGCGNITATGTITVDANNTATLSSAAGTDGQTVCINTAVTNITYAIGGSATGASVSGLPAGVSGSYSAGVYTISGTATASGTFNYTVTTTGGSCSAATATGSITVNPAPVGGAIADVSICYADNGTLTLTGNVGGVVRWETSNDLSSWTNISNTTTSQSFSGLTTTTWYRALVQSGACASPVYSNNAKVGIHNLWTGNVSSDWNTGANWSDGLTPTTSCPDVTIPVLTSPNVYPQLTYGVATINNIIIHPNATMIVSNASLQVAGTITNNGVLDITHGTLEMNGTVSAQTIAGSVFDTHTIQNVVISNPNGVNLANTNDTLRITGVVSFGANNAVFNTNGNLTLVSNATGTASVGDLTNGGTLTGTDVTGNVTVERYIPTHPKAWQFLAVPTSGQSINDSWQEGNTTLANRNPGYGSIITGEMAGAVAAGFDVYTPAGPSMKTYNPATALWVGVANTTMQIDNKKGYMFFIRGDRSVTAFNQAATSTTMRTTGKLFTFGASAPASTTVLAGKFESIGNPYASAIDFTTINKPIAPDVDDAFYAWDPLLTNNYLGLGGYQTISAANGWKPIPGGTANYDANTPYPYIQSGQAFFVHATGAGGTVSFAESNKVNQYSMANRVTTTSSTMANRQFLRTYLYNASSMLSDGNVVAFDNNFSNNYDANDAVKIANSSENFSIVKGDKYLALEARSPVVSEDTVFYSFGNVRRTAYQFRFNPEHMAPGLTAKLVDNFLHTVTPISMTDTSSFNFSVTTDAGSYAGNRFYLIFDQAPPVAITTISATRNNNVVTVNWRVEHEAGITQYELQKSTDGNNFSTIMLADPFGNNTGTFNYSGLDQNPARVNYYRVKGIKTDGTQIYSAIVRLGSTGDGIVMGKNQNAGSHVADIETPAVEKTGISIYPNPVMDKILNIQFFNQAKGTYKLELINKLGQIIYSGRVTVNGISQYESIHLNTNVVPGIYQLKIKSPVNTDSVQQVIIQ